MKLSITYLKTEQSTTGQEPFLAHSIWEINEKNQFLPSFDADMFENVTHMSLHETRFYTNIYGEDACIFRYE